MAARESGLERDPPHREPAASTHAAATGTTAADGDGAATVATVGAAATATDGRRRHRQGVIPTPLPPASSVGGPSQPVRVRFLAPPIRVAIPAPRMSHTTAAGDELSLTRSRPTVGEEAVR